MIPQDKIAEINETARIDEVVQDFITLKKRGANLLGLCPFHDEKTPSFTVSPAKGIYKCFGCGKAGNSVGFVMEHEKYSFPEALKYLARKYNIEIVEEQLSPEQEAQADEKESLYVVSQYAAEYFKDQLYETEEGKNIGLAYFKERGFKPSTIEKFQLGYSPESWDAFTSRALEKGYKLEFLEKTGLTIVKEEGDKKFDRFKGRVMFPIHNISGRVIGFGGRILKTEAKAAKYLNSPESEIYHKSKVLYGLYQAKKEISKSDVCLLVEGYTDVISLNQAGIENVVSSSGTSLTEDQIKLIKRYTKNITILFDGDLAGIKASFRGIDMILGAGMNVKVVLFPKGEDPDSFAKKLSTDDLRSFIDANSKDFIRFKTTVLKDEIIDDPTKKAALIKDTIHSISLIPDAITRSVYIKECSSLIDVDENVLIQELNKERRKNINQNIREQAVEQLVAEDDFPAPRQFEEQKDFQLDLQERDILRMLLKYGRSVLRVEVESLEENAEVERSEMRLDHLVILELESDHIKFENKLFQRIFEEYKALIHKEEDPSEEYFIHHLNHDIASIAIDLLSSRYHLDNWVGKNIHTALEGDNLLPSIEKYLYYYKLAKVKAMLNDNKKLIQENRDDDAVYQLMKKQVGLEAAKKELAMRLGNVTL